MDFRSFRDQYAALADLKDQAAVLLEFANENLQTCPDDLVPLLSSEGPRFLAAGKGVEAGHCERILGWIAYDRAEFARAAELFGRAHERFLTLGDRLGQVRALNGIAAVHSAQGRPEPALDVLREALALAEALGDQLQVRTFKANIGDTLNDLQRYTEAEVFLRESLGEDTPLNRAIGLTQLARTYAALGRTDEARAALTEAEALARQHSFLPVLAEVLVHRGTLDRAPERLDDARAVARQAGNPAREAQALVERGTVDLERGEATRATENFLEALDLSRTLGTRYSECEAWKGLHQSWKAQGRVEAALEALENYLGLREQLQGEAVNRQVAALQDDLTRRETALLQDQTRTLARLGDLGQKITASLDPEVILLSVYEGLGELMKADAFGLGIYRADPDCLEFRLTIENGLRLPPFDLPASRPSFSGWVLEHAQPLLVRNVSLEWSRFFSGPPPSPREGTLAIQSGLYTPVLAKGQVLGVLTAQSLVPEAYTERDLATLRNLATSVAVALENARLFGEVTRLATIDGLTGAATRRFLFERAEEEFHRFRRERGTMALVMVDLDHFKTLNDTWGHATGDKVLAAFGALCLRVKRPHDLFGRYGGEEFVLVLAGTDIDGAQAFAQRLCNAVRAMEAPSGAPADLRVTASFGVTDFQPGDTTVEQVLARADAALYEAKHGGRDRIVARKTL